MDMTIHYVWTEQAIHIALSVSEILEYYQGFRNIIRKYFPHRFLVQYWWGIGENKIATNDFLHRLLSYCYDPLYLVNGETHFWEGLTRLLGVFIGDATLRPTLSFPENYMIGYLSDITGTCLEHSQFILESLRRLPSFPAGLQCYAESLTVNLSDYDQSCFRHYFGVRLWRTKAKLALALGRETRRILTIHPSLSSWVQVKSEEDLIALLQHPLFLLFLLKR